MKMGEENKEETVKVGSYVVVQRQNFRKLYKVMKDGKFTLNKNQIEVNEIIEKPYWTTFKMIQSENSRKNMTLEVVDRAETVEDLRKGLESGTDNRSITDDGTSQKLSKEEILDLKESGKSGKEIVGCLIENSTSFVSKTEYSQEKYIKKKESKYCRYITILKPSISLLQEIYFKHDINKINCLRMDTLSQILSYCDVKADGKYLLYDSGSAGLAPASMLNRIGANTSGSLLYFHPGNEANVTLVKAMNFPDEQLTRFKAVNIYTFLRLFHQGIEVVQKELAIKYTKSGRIGNNFKRLIDLNREESDESEVKRRKIEECDGNRNKNNDEIGETEHEEDDKLKNQITEEEKCQVHENENEKEKGEETLVEECKNNEKNKNSSESNKKHNETWTFTVPLITGSNHYEVTLTKPLWLGEHQKAVNDIKVSKADGLTVIAKEHPLNIVNALLPYLGTSKPFVIYHCCREPLQETYVALKQRRNIINLKLFSNFCRGYQVLPYRTHPEIMTNDLGGYLLSGYLIN